MDNKGRSLLLLVPLRIIKISVDIKTIATKLRQLVVLETRHSC